MQRAVDVGDLGELAAFQRRAHQALIDDGGGTASLRNNRFTGQLGHERFSSVIK